MLKHCQYKFKKVWFYLQCFQFLLIAGSYTWQPPHYIVDHVLYNIILINLWLSIMKQNFSLQATTHASLLAGTRLQLLFTSLTVSKDIWKSLLLHHFDQKRNKTFNRKTEDVAHTSLRVIIPIVHFKTIYKAAMMAISYNWDDSIKN